MIYIRTDANEHIGTGHIMRCISLANELHRMGVDCTFATSDHTADKLLQLAQQKGICLDSNWNDLDSELPKFIDVIKSERTDAIIVDHYYVTDSYLSGLQKYAKVIYMDDRNTFCYPCDALVNYNLFALDWAEKYCEQYRGGNTKLFLGPSYAPLRSEFTRVPLHIQNDSVRDVLVSTGGADVEDVSVIISSMIAEESSWDKYIFHFVVGSLSPNKERLIQRAKDAPNIVFHYNVQNMSELMNSCDIAIAAAGSTLYELCACGTPTATYIVADNQIPGASAFGEKRIMLNAGDAREKNFVGRLKSSVQLLMDNAQLRREMSKEMKRVVDGNGAARLATELLEMKLICS